MVLWSLNTFNDFIFPKTSQRGMHAMIKWLHTIVKITQFGRWKYLYLKHEKLHFQILSLFIIYLKSLKIYLQFTFEKVYTLQNQKHFAISLFYIIEKTLWAKKQSFQFPGVDAEIKCYKKATYHEKTLSRSYESLEFCNL